MEELESILLRQAVEQVPAIWEQIKPEVISDEIGLKLNYVGTFAGLPLVCNITKFKIGSIFVVHCTLGQHNISAHLKGHITSKKR